MHRKLVFPLVIFFLFVTTPYLLAVYLEGPQHRFGGFLFNVYDGNSYLAKMYQGWRGEWRFKLPYTADPGEGAYLFLFYIFLGQVSRWTHSSLIMVFHLARLFGAGLLSWALFRLIIRSGAAGSWSVWGFVLALLGSGSGWLLSPFGILTSDFWVAEAYPFLSAYATPHFSIGLALLIWIFLGAVQPPSGGLAWRTGIPAFLLSVISPFGVVLALFVLAGWSSWELIKLSINNRLQGASRLHFYFRSVAKSTAMQSLFWVTVCGSPLLFYELWAIHSDALLSGWNYQNLTPSPKLWDTLLSLSPALIVAVGGWYSAWKANTPRAVLLVSWSLLGFLLLYLPFGLQRRFMMGLFVPIACLAGWGMQWLAEKGINKVRLWASLVLLLSLPTNFMIFLSARYGVITHDAMIYLHHDEAAALDWIEQNTENDALILASPEMGLFIPAHTGRRVIYGHPFETVNAEEEKRLVTEFFSSESTMDRQAFLKHRDVQYVFLGSREHSLGSPPYLDYLQIVYSMGDVQILKVTDSSE